MTYFRTFRHYHRLKGLNGRVRNGNECFPPEKVTGKRPGYGLAHTRSVTYKKIAFKRQPSDTLAEQGERKEFRTRCVGQTVVSSLSR
jgi:hypothetical protein